MYRRTREELIAALKDQLAMLESSCTGYDAGNLWEGPRIATALYNIVNDGASKTKSILTQLGVRSHVDFVSYAHPNDPQNLVPWIPLTIVGPLPDQSLGFLPQLGVGTDPVSFLKFADWWAEPVFQNRAKQTLSRMNLTFALRSKDGGSHFDGELPIAPYLELKQGKTGYFKGADNEVILVLGDGAPPPDAKELPRTAHLATMRSVAFELQESIRLHLQSRGYNSVEQLL